MFDYIIVGGGISGSICAYELSRRNYKCLILEKETDNYEKVCGGGVSYKALNLLESIGISTSPLFGKGAIINGHIVCTDDLVNEKNYKKEKVSLGIQRSIFDSYLREQASNQGTIIRYGEPVSKVNFSKGIYCVNSFKSNNIIWASGSRSINGSIPPNQSIGISAQIKAKLNLQQNKFYYWYFDKDSLNKYFWTFPIGNNLWNIGLWSRTPYKKMKRDYVECFQKYIFDTLVIKERYIHTPRAEFLGHFDQRNRQTQMQYGVGDFAGMCNPQNGGGIIGAIKSALNFADEL